MSEYSQEYASGSASGYANDSSTVSGVYDSSLIINSRDFDYVVTKLRLFFKSKGFILSLIHISEPTRPY